jgi:ferredoxin
VCRGVALSTAFILPPNEPGFDASEQLFINPDECIDRGACEPACPVTAILEESAVPEAGKGFIQRNRAFFRE